MCFSKLNHLQRIADYFLIICLGLGGVIEVKADAPVGYYTSAEGKAGSELRLALHNIVRNHHVVPYSSGSSTDTADALAVLDRNPLDTNYVVEIYSGSNALVSTFGLTTGWNREHQWCDSYGLDGVEPAYSDLHNLRAVDANVNSSRGNKYYDVSDTNNANYRYPAHAEAPLCSTDIDSWEPPLLDRGNIARSLFYMAIRYTGDVANEPALVLTDNTLLIQATNSYMGKLSTILAWHLADPVDEQERLRNDRTYWQYQTNRNPFVDHPEWVNLTFAPAATNPPTLQIYTLSNSIVLRWLATNQSCHLQWATNPSSSWLDATNTVTLTNGHFGVWWPNTGSSRLFRLRAQP